MIQKNCRLQCNQLYIQICMSTALRTQSQQPAAASSCSLHMHPIVPQKKEKNWNRKNDEGVNGNICARIFVLCQNDQDPAMTFREYDLIWEEREKFATECVLWIYTFNPPMLLLYLRKKSISSVPLPEWADEVRKPRSMHADAQGKMPPKKSRKSDRIERITRT